jgi:hypothetical protein
MSHRCLSLTAFASLRRSILEAESIENEHSREKILYFLDELDRELTEFASEYDILLRRLYPPGEWPDDR